MDVILVPPTFDTQTPNHPWRGHQFEENMKDYRIVVSK